MSGFVLLLFTLIMFFITYFYNHFDWYDNKYIDTLVQILHIIALLYIFSALVYFNHTLIALFCAYLIFKNIKWFLYGSSTENKEDDDDENEER